MDTTVAELLLQRGTAGFPIPARRRQGLPAPIRALHRRQLGHFAATGQAPAPATLAVWAAKLGVGLQDALSHLVKAPLVEADPASARLQELRARGVQLVEVLPPAEYAEEHPPGAISLSLKELDATTARLDPDRPVIV